MLRKHYTKVDCRFLDGMHWIRVNFLKTPNGWSPNEIPVVFSVTEGYPGVQPYGFFVPVGLTPTGHIPVKSDVSSLNAFKGEWRFLSWTSENWIATHDITSGSNLWNWVRSFVGRLQEGA